MRTILRNLRLAWWEFIHPMFDPPDDFDEVSTAARRQYIAGQKHPPECKGGCQCKYPEGGDTS